MLRHCQLILAEGHTAAVYASLLWDRMDELQHGALLWDIQPNAKRFVFEDAARHASRVAVGIGTGGPEVLAWLQATAPRARTACIHLACATASVPAILDYGQAMLRQIEYDCLYCLLPAAWLGPRRIAEALGFVKIASLPASCFIFNRNRCVAGVMLHWLRPQRDG